MIRAAVAETLQAMRWPRSSGTAESILRSAWPQDRMAAAILTKAATAPATTTTAGWAAELAAGGVTETFFTNLQESAAAVLFAAALKVSLDGAAALRVPYNSATPSLSPSFVAEGAPIPVRQAAFTSITLAPKKMAVITAVSGELESHSMPVASAIIGQLLTQAAGVALDSAVFSAAAADATRPAGILNGVSGLTPTAGGGLNAFLGDLKNLAAALATAGAGRRIMLFMSPSAAMAVPVYMPGSNLEIVTSPILANTVIAVDPAGVATAFSGLPEIVAGSEGTLHFEDTTPLQFSTGSPGSATLATPMRSLYQSDSYSLRLVTRCSWGVRPSYVAYVSNVTW